MDASNVLALSSDWLNQSNAGAALTTTTMACSGYGCNTTYYYPWGTYPTYITSPARPIKLTLSDIEKLRKLAKADKAIREILMKFTDQIEITVDF